MKTKEFPRTPWSIRWVPEPGEPGHWGGNRVSVLRDGEPWHEYSYDYGQSPPFFPFLSGGDWFALYSVSYTATRVLRLTPAPQDWCGQDEDTFGFCPVELHVPSFKVHSSVHRLTHRAGVAVEPYEATRHDYLFDPARWPAPGTLRDTEHAYGHRLSEVGYCPIGFVSGCVWGDDTSWKLQAVDLSRLADRVAPQSDAFGYVELPPSLSLSECVSVSYPDSHAMAPEELFAIRRPFSVTVTRTTDFQVADGDLANAKAS